MIEVQNLTKYFGSTLAVDYVSFKLSESRIHGEFLWAWQNRARIGFGGFRLFAQPKAFSGSMHDRKSRAHARISTDSLACPKILRLDGG